MDEETGEKTGQDTVVERDVTVVTPDGPMRCREAGPPGRARGAVVVIMEGYGLNDYVEDVVRRLAREGYHALAPNLFHRSGNVYVSYEDVHLVVDRDTGAETTTTGPAAMSQLLSKIPGDAGLMSDVDAALGHLRAVGFSDERIGIMGFCFGGRIAFLAALERHLGGAVSFYGDVGNRGRAPAANVSGDTPGGDPLGQFPSLISRAPSLRTPYCGLFGEEDPYTPAEEIEELRSSLVDATVESEVVEYAGVGHAFHNEWRPSSYHPEQAAQAWARMLTWFDRTLAG
jgi:carboxymethylenebutenolidase